MEASFEHHFWKPALNAFCHIWKKFGSPVSAVLISSDEILRVVALADAIVLPYKDRKGAYAVSGILHLSMGGLKPIIGSRTPRLIELYQFAPDLTVPPNNPKELANKIKWLVDNYDYAVAYMSELYSYAARTQWIRVAYRHLRLYRNLLGDGLKMD